VNHFHFFVAVLVLSFFAGSGLSTAQGTQPFGAKIDKPASTVSVPKAKTGQDSQVGPAVPGQGVRKVDCFDETAYGRAKSKTRIWPGPGSAGPT